MTIIIEGQPTGGRVAAGSHTRIEAAIAAFLAFALTLAVRLPTLGRQSLWADEVYTANAVAMAWPDLAAERLAAGHFPTYFLLLKALGLSPHSEMLLRLPSALAVGGAAAILTLIALRLAGRIGALAVALLVAGHPALVFYGQEARPYALMLLFLAIGMRGQLALLADEAWDDGKPARAAMVATLGSLGAILSIPAAIVSVAASHGALVATGALKQGGERRRLVLWHMLVTWLVTGVAALALIPSVIATSQKPTGLMKWQASESVMTRLSGVWRELFGLYVLRDANAFLPAQWEVIPSLGLVAAAIVGAWLGRKRPSVSYLAVIVIITGIAYLGVGSFTATVSRYLLGILLPFLLLVGFAASQLTTQRGSRRTLAAMVFTALVAMAVAQGLDGTRSEARYDWRHLAAFIAGSGIADSAIVTNEFHAPLLYRYYQPNDPQPAFAYVNRYDAIIEQAKVGDPRYLLLFYGGNRLPDEVAAGKTVCNWVQGDATFFAITADPQSLPAPLRGCAGGEKQ